MRKLIGIFNEWTDGVGQLYIVLKDGTVPGRPVFEHIPLELAKQLVDELVFSDKGYQFRYTDDGTLITEDD